MNCNNISKTNKEAVSVFFAADDKYLPYLEVTIASLVSHADKSRKYDLYVLSSGFSDESLRDVRKMLPENISVRSVDLTEKIAHLKDKLSLRLRDYYSESIFYRLFIPSMFEGLSRAVYLDSDIVLLDDVAKLYDTDLGEEIIGAVPDESVITVPVFCDYVKGYVGVPNESCYFNSGVLVLDLDGFRREKIEEKFIALLTEHNFHTVAPDQDYLNFLCSGKVCYLPSGWNKHAIVGRDIPKEELHLVHFNMFNKPWHYDGVPYESYFWEYAGLTPKAGALIEAKRSYTDEQRRADMEAGGRLIAAAGEILANERPIFEICQR